MVPCEVRPHISTWTAAPAPSRCSSDTPMATRVEISMMMLDMVAEPPVGRDVVPAHITPPAGRSDHPSRRRRKAVGRVKATGYHRSPVAAAGGQAFCEEDFSD